MSPPAKRRRLLPNPLLLSSPSLRHLSLLRRRRRRTRTLIPPPHPPRDPPHHHDDEEKEMEEQEVQVDFGFFDPKPSDFHGVKLLFRTFLDGKVWDLSGFVDLIVEQTTVGTVVKSDDGEGGRGGDEDLYAVVSALNLGRYGGCKCVEEVVEYVLGVCGDEALKARLGSLLRMRANEVGLLVCERFVNFPNQAVPPLYDGLFEEIGWATEDEPTQEKRDSFRFKYFLIVTKIFVDKNAAQGTSKAKVSSSLNNKASLKECSKNCDDDSIVYAKAEDEIFRKLSSLNFTFDLQPGQSIPPEMKNYRKLGLIMIVEAERVSTFREELKQLIES